MPRSGPREVHRYSDEFKLAAVGLSQQPGVHVQTVAAPLEIHPFMLSKWRKDVKDARLRGRLARPGLMIGWTKSRSIPGFTGRSSTVPNPSDRFCGSTGSTRQMPAPDCCRRSNRPT